MAGVKEAFQVANDRIAESARRLAFTAPVPFLCECDTASCYEIVRLPLPEYRRRRAAGERVTISAHAERPTAIGQAGGPCSFGGSARPA
jgi:hypothetical protein